MKRFAQYLAVLAKTNALGKQVDWLFYPGMLQESRAKWWDDFAWRPKAHEGVDICFYRQGQEKITPLAKDTRVPAMDKGLILNRCEDFLGESLVITHGKIDDDFPRVVLVYSHLEIDKTLVPGNWVEKGEIIARLFDTGKKQSKLLSHLHLSCIELMDKIPLEDLNWKLFPDRKKINLINPVFL